MYSNYSSGAGVAITDDSASTVVRPSNWGGLRSGTSVLFSASSGVDRDLSPLPSTYSNTPHGGSDAHEVSEHSVSIQ